MSELLNYYYDQAKARLSSLPWLADLQQKALDDFAQKGFPKRWDEEWKYTQIEAFLQQRFVINTDDDVKAYKSDTPVDYQISIVNGAIAGIDALRPHLPDGVIIAPLSEAIMNHADHIKPYLLEDISHQHGFQALNTAMLQTGLFIYVPKGVKFDQPVLLSHWQDKENQAVYSRHLIVAEEKSRLTIVEEYRGAEQSAYFTNTLTDIHVHRKATITHYKFQRESVSAYHIGHISVKQGDDSAFNSHSLSLGGKLVRSDMAIQLQEEQAHCLMNGIYAPNNGQHIDHHTTVHHAVPNCYSQQDYKGVLAGRSRAVFNGKVIVAKDAQHTEAKQQNKNLLLSRQAEIDTKPQLEIYADDVICTHGATVGQLDEDALFYMATRGIGREEASAFLIQAFAAENIRLFPEPALAEWAGHLLTKQLG